MKKIVDLFAGCGGLSLGFQNAGFEIVGAFECWKPAALCYENNFNHHLFFTDLTDVDYAVNQIRELNPDIIIGGPPCQEFSHAGKRVEDKIAALTESFAKIVVAIGPQWFVMENVDRAQKSAAYVVARKIFKDAGYGLTEVVLNASLCGAPQRRKRFFCIGSIEAQDGFLDGYIRQNLSETEMTLRDYFGNSLDFEYYYRHPRNYSRRAIYSINEPSATIRGVNRPVPLGYPGHQNDACKLNDSIRAMTTLERALIQTFPPNFKWVGNKTETEQMIGNAVPVKLAEFVAKVLAHHIVSTENTSLISVDYSLFQEWLGKTQSMSDRVRHDNVSRLKRANSICKIPANPDSLYLFLLEQTDEFKELSTSIRSQLRRAVNLYSDFRRAGTRVNG